MAAETRHAPHEAIEQAGAETPGRGVTPAETELVLPHEHERDPGVPRFLWVVYVVLLGFGLVYFALNVVPPARPQAAPAAEVVAEVGAADAELGKLVFENQRCSACHQTTGEQATIAPNLSGVAGRAAEVLARAGYTGQATSPEEYLRESIVQPGTYVVPGFTDGVMPRDFGDRLPDADLEKLVAYLMSLTR